MSIKDYLQDISTLDFDYQVLLYDKTFIDTDYLFDSFDNDTDFLTELLSLLFNDLDNRFNKLEGFLKEKNYNEARFIIHKLKGTSAVYGMVKANKYLTHCEDNLGADSLTQITYIKELFANYKLFFSKLLNYKF